MSRHRGIAPAALCFVLALTQTGCSGPDQANPTTTSRPSPTLTSTTTSTPRLDIAVTRPKHVDENTPCQEVVTAADASAATGATATPGISGPFLCYYELTKADGSDEGLLSISCLIQNEEHSKRS